MDEPFAYLGTGKEVFFSMLKFIFIVIFPTVILFTLLGVYYPMLQPFLQPIQTFFLLGF